MTRVVSPCIVLAMAEEPQPDTFPQVDGGVRFAYRLPEVAALTGVSEATLRELTAQRQIPHVRVNKTNIVLTPAQIQTLLDVFTVDADQVEAENTSKEDPEVLKKRERIKQRVAARKAAA